MLSLQRCREILGPNFKITDDQLEDLRAQLYSAAELSIALWPAAGSEPRGKSQSDTDAASEEETP